MKNQKKILGTAAMVCMAAGGLAGLRKFRGKQDRKQRCRIW